MCCRLLWFPKNYLPWSFISWWLCAFWEIFKLIKRNTRFKIVLTPLCIRPPWNFGILILFAFFPQQAISTKIRLLRAVILWICFYYKMKYILKIAEKIISITRICCCITTVYICSGDLYNGCAENMKYDSNTYIVCRWEHFRPISGEPTKTNR